MSDQSDRISGRSSPSRHLQLTEPESEAWVVDEVLADLAIDAIGGATVPALVDEVDDPVLARAQERFFDWLARDLRLRQRPTERADAMTRATTFAERMVARLAATRAHVQIVDAPPASVTREMTGAATGADTRRWAPLADLAVAAGAGRELWDQECESVVEVPADAPAGRYVALRVAGDSMTPLLHSGDTVLVKLGPDVSRDSIVVARCDDGYVVKRVGRIERRELELVSLNPTFPSIRVAREADRVLGTVVLRWCGHG
jgi:SOS-response transcriptional repressor LexA